MRVVVLGSGVVGVTTAYYLAADGHETVALDTTCDDLELGCILVGGGVQNRSVDGDSKMLGSV